MAGSAFVVVPDGYGKVLSVSRGPGGWVWGLPGGMQEPGENLYQTAVRELREETGVHPTGPMTTLIHRPNRAFFYLDKYTGTIRGSHEGDVAWMAWPELIARGGRWAKILNRLHVQCGC